MSIKEILRNVVNNVEVLGALRDKYNNHKQWNIRIREVMNCPDNEHISRVPSAGSLYKTYQLMHNGQKILKGSYYGNGNTKMLLRNKGVHEPQEERIFAKVLEALPKAPTIVELGSYWGFYSMWFLQKRPLGKAILYEPELENLEFGKENFKLNNLEGDFNRAFISSKIDLTQHPPQITLSHILKSKKLKFIDVLHSDIQGYELQFLQECHAELKTSVGYMFISTHTNGIHAGCLKIIKAASFEIISEVNLDDSYSYDGIIVARNPSYAGIPPMNISRKTQDRLRS